MSLASRARPLWLSTLAALVVSTGCGSDTDDLFGAGASAGGSDGVGGGGGAGGSGEPVPVELHVDAESGQDSSDGTIEQPLKTIGRALEVWTEGRVIVLHAGTYSAASGETWGYSFPDGLALQPNTDGVVLRGTPGDVAFAFDGDGAVQHLTFEGFGTAVRASSGTQSLIGVRFDGNDTAIDLLGDATMSVSDYSAFVGGAVASVTAYSKLSIAAATMDELAATEQGAALVVSGEARLTLSQLALDEVHATFLSVDDSSVVELADSTMTNSGAVDGLIGAWGSSTVKLTDFSVTGTTDGPAISMDGASTTLFVDGGSYSSGELAAIRGRGNMTVAGASFSQHADGAVSVGGGGVATLTGCLFQENWIGVAIDADADVTIRDTVFSENWGAVTAGSLPDLGADSDLGGNSFTGSELHSNVAVQQGLTGTLEAVGNTWELDTQGSDSSGHYSAQVVAGPYGGQNFAIPMGVAIQL